MRVKLMSYRVPPSTLPQALLWSDQPTVPQISTQIHEYTTQKYTNTKIHKYPNIQLYTQIYPTCLRRSCSQTNIAERVLLLYWNYSLRHQCFVKRKIGHQVKLFAPVQCCGVGEKCAVLGYKGREGSQSKCGLHSQKDTGTTLQRHRVMSSVARQCKCICVLLCNTIS